MGLHAVFSIKDMNESRCDYAFHVQFVLTFTASERLWSRFSVFVCERTCSHEREETWTWGSNSDNTSSVVEPSVWSFMCFVWSWCPFEPDVSGLDWVTVPCVVLSSDTAVNIATLGLLSFFFNAHCNNNNLTSAFLTPFLLSLSLPSNWSLGE